MTRKDYVLIAQALNTTRPPASHGLAHSQWLDDVMSLARALSATNPRFERARFVSACNGGE